MRIKITGVKDSFCVPGRYSIGGSWNDKKVKKMYSNFFFYLLGGKIGDRFDVRGRLIRVDDEYFLELSNRGNYKEYYMNLFKE